MDKRSLQGSYLYDNMIREIIDLHCSSLCAIVFFYGPCCLNKINDDDDDIHMICVNLVFPIGLSHCGIVYRICSFIPTLNTFKARLDRFWENQEVRYNLKADILYTGSRSNVELMF